MKTRLWMCAVVIAVVPFFAGCGDDACDELKLICDKCAAGSAEKFVCDGYVEADDTDFCQQSIDSKVFANCGG